MLQALQYETNNLSSRLISSPADQGMHKKYMNKNHNAQCTVNIKLYIIRVQQRDIKAIIKQTVANV